ncbi:MAG: thymidine phosphorylase [Synergistaceae bacterium]|nr:thymidine phosphorylase [Synergistaceae bacterium]
MNFNGIEFIEKKRDGLPHNEEEFHAFIEAVMHKTIPDYQISAWLMAAFLNGLDDDELIYFTLALAGSGKTMIYPPEERIIDKHSTGGVGDKTTLVLVPLVAACGARISKLSGPGLGYTGGTIDKLESIPGINMHLSEDEFRGQVDKIGCAISGHSVKLAPAEGKFYKLRDVTGTVPSIPLITASIISKKLAGGAYGYLFDVKCGSGAFMNDIEKARELAQKLVEISKKLGKECVAVITDMEQPLGEWTGNSAEVREAIEILSGSGPSDTRELCLTLAGHMLNMSGRAGTADEGTQLAAQALDNGTALKKFEELISAQNGDSSVARDPERVLPRASSVCEIRSDRKGYLSRLDALLIGEGLRALGGGRLTQEDIIDPSVAIQLLKKVGDKVCQGDVLLRIYYNHDEQLLSALSYVNKCWQVGDSAVKRKLIIDMVY